MGGMLTMLLAAQRGDVVQAAVPFYGFPTGEGEPDWSGLAGRVRGHMSAEDAFFPADAANDLAERLRGMGKDVEFTIHGAGHAFMNEENALGSYDADLAAELWPQVVAFLRDNVS